MIADEMHVCTTNRKEVHMSLPKPMTGATPITRALSREAAALEQVQPPRSTAPDYDTTANATEPAKELFF